MFAAIYGCRKAPDFSSRASFYFAEDLRRLFVIHLEAFFERIFERFDVFIPFDFEAVRQTFLKGYYGPAAPYVDAFRKLVEKAQKRGDTKVINRHRAIGFDFYNIDELIENLDE